MNLEVEKNIRKLEKIQRTRKVKDIIMLSGVAVFLIILLTALVSSVAYFFGV